MLLDGILEHNRGFVRGRASSPLPPPETLQLAVVACYDPRLDQILPAALGIARERTFVFRTAGTVIRPEGDLLRSLALAVYMFGVTEIVVVGHSSCRMAMFSSSAFIDAFRARGVARDAFGPLDLREWVAAIPDPRRGVVSSVAAIASAAFLPPDLLVSGLVLDDASGALEVVVPPERRAAIAGIPAAAPEAPPVAAASPPPPAEAETVPRAEIHEVEAVRSFVASLEATAWRDELRKLRAELDRNKSPVARIALVERFFRRSVGNAREIAGAFERLKKDTISSGRSVDAERLIDLFRSGGRRQA